MNFDFMTVASRICTGRQCLCINDTSTEIFRLDFIRCVTSGVVLDVKRLGKIL